MPISLTFNTTSGELDLAISNGALVTGQDIVTLVFFSLFTSAVEAAGLDSYWGSTFAGYPIGSGLPYLLKGVKSGDGGLINQAKDYAVTALTPLLTNGIITSLDVQCGWVQFNSYTTAIEYNISIGVAGSETPQLIKFGINNTGTNVIYSS